MPSHSQADELMTLAEVAAILKLSPMGAFGDLRLLLGLSLRGSGPSGGGTSRRGGEWPSMLRA